MRDIGILVWVALLLVGVVSSMVSSIRKQMQNAPRSPGAVPVANRFAAQPQALSQSPPPRPAPAPVAHPRAQPPPLAPPRSETVSQTTAVRRRLFGSGPELVRAVIAAEVLGKPRALRDE